MDQDHQEQAERSGLRLGIRCRLALIMVLPLGALLAIAAWLNADLAGDTHTAALAVQEDHDRLRAESSRFEKTITEQLRQGEKQRASAFNLATSAYVLSRFRDIARRTDLVLQDTAVQATFVGGETEEEKSQASSLLRSLRRGASSSQAIMLDTAGQELVIWRGGRRIEGKSYWPNNTTTDESESDWFVRLKAQAAEFERSHYVIWGTNQDVLTDDDGQALEEPTPNWPFLAVTARRGEDGKWSSEDGEVMGYVVYILSSRFFDYHIRRAADAAVEISFLTSESIIVGQAEEQLSWADDQLAVGRRLHFRNEGKLYPYMFIETRPSPERVARVENEVHLYRHNSDRLEAGVRDRFENLEATVASKLDRNLGRQALISLVILALGAGSAALIARKLRRLSSVAEALARREGVTPQSIRALATGHDEVASLGRSLSSLQSNLLDHERKDREKRESLEAQVLSRTEALALQNEELAQAEKRALAAVEAKANFVANMSHELRSPLHGVIGLVDLIQPHIRPEGRSMLAEQKACGEHLLGVINDILDHAKLEAGELKLSPVPFAVDELLAGPVAAAGRQAVEKGLRYEVIRAPDVPTHAQMDGPRLRQVILNLVSNAVKFTAQGCVTIRMAKVLGLSEHEARLVVSVEDTGAGIKLERQEAIFEVFQQEDDDTAVEHGGTGLGLAISRRIVEAHEGFMGLVSQPGQGSTFSFEIPLVEVSSDEAGASTQEEAPRRALRVLVADDDQVNRRIAETYLRAAGHEVVLATDGDQAVRLLAQEPLDLACLDLQMPGRSGFAVAEAVREAERDGSRKGHLPLLALTGSNDEATVAKCFQRGFDAHLAKPFRAPDLASGLEAALNQAHGYAAPGLR